MDGMERIKNKMRENRRTLFCVGLFLLCLIIVFLRYVIIAKTVLWYMRVIYEWAGYARYFFGIVLFCSFFREDDDYGFWAVIFAVEYAVHFLMSYSYCLLFTRGSFTLFLEMAGYFFVYVTCPAVIAFLIGRLCRKIRFDTLAVTAVLLAGAVFVFNIVQEVLLFPWFHLSERSYTLISKAFIIFNHSLIDEYGSNTFAPFYVGVNDVGTALFWLGLLGLLQGIVKKKIAALLPAVLVVCSVCLMNRQENKYEAYINRTIFSTQSMMQDSWRYDHLYYWGKQIIMEDREPVRADTEFVIEGYELEITAGVSTKFTAVLQLSQADVDAYTFSLYHRYQVQSITDEKGIPLEYSQEDDYITVFSPGKPLTEITMEYEGTALTYMASVDYTCLPEHYIYYPVAGKYILFELQSNNYSKNIDLPKTRFLVTVHADYEVYSNIPGTGYNSFEGIVTGPMLVGGKYLSSVEVDGVTVVYSALMADEEEIAGQYRRIVENHEERKVPLDIKMWFGCPYYGGSYSRYYLGEDYLFGNYEDLIYFVPGRFGAGDWLGGF